MRAVTAAEMRRIEDEAIAAGSSVDRLMQLAGMAVADAVVETLGGRVAQRRVLVLAGPGKNGGDGLIAARVLAQRGAAVTVVCPVPRGDDDPLIAECAAASCSIFSDIPSDFGAALSKAEVVVDAVLGTGRSRAIEGSVRDALNKVADARGRRDGLKVVAVDVPSGLDSDTGEADAATVAADVTVALGSVKRGCLTPTGASYCGQIRVADIGLGPVSGEIGIEILDCPTVAGMLPNRPSIGHKGTFGHAVIVGGSEAYRGAPALAARAAARAGAGTVAIAAPESVTDSIAPMAPEATHLPLSVDDDLLIEPRRALIQMLASFGLRQPEVVAIGPGLGKLFDARDLLLGLFDLIPQGVPSVLDADALNILGGVEEWWTKAETPVVVTPHPGEMARLCGVSVEDVQAARVEIAAEKADEWGVTVVLKGAYTVIASPAEPPVVCPLAFPALASGGTGDALAGIITGFLAQNLAAFDAARAGVYVHGVAAVLAAEGNGNLTSGLLASDLIERIPAAMGLVQRGGPAPLPMFA